LQSKFSLRQTVAMALVGVDTASLAVYGEATACDPGLIRLRERVTIDFQKNWPQTVAEVEVESTDGRRLAARHDSGIPAADIAEQGGRLAAKFDALVVPVCGAARARELRGLVAVLDGAAEFASLARLAAG
jgi:hypothetical protein